VVRRLTQPNPSFTFTRPGAYIASLTVTDAQGAQSSADVQVVAGNEPPTVAVDLVGGNTSFYFPGVPVRYQVRVTDREDGSLRSGSIPPRRVSVTAEFLKDGVPAIGTDGWSLIEGSDCLSCHQLNRTSVGPTYADVARKYKNDSTATAHLARRIREGGSGVWGPVAMPAHPNLTDKQASAMAAYVLSLTDGNAIPPLLPVRGAYVPPAGSGDAPTGAVVLRAEYTDRGANGMPAISKEQTIVLRSPSVVVASGERSEGVSTQSVAELPVEITIVNRSGGSVALKQLDLTGVVAVTFSAVAPAQYQATGGKIEVHLDSATGPLLGESELLRPTANPAAPPSLLRTVLQPTSGLHDVYLVFRNPGALGDGFMFGLLTATFEAVPR
jgi:cytochrome c